MLYSSTEVVSMEQKVLWSWDLGKMLHGETEFLK